MARDRLWPYQMRVAVLWVPILFVALLLGLAVLRSIAQWPPPTLDQSIFIAIVILSVLPVLLAVVDFVAERGGAISFRGVTLDFSAAGVAVPTVTVPANVGLPGQPVSDSGTENIVHVLRGAVGTDAVIVDLEDGIAWWETRLLVLLAGAARRSRPGAVVFVATDGGVAQRFQGWAAPRDLLPLLIRVDRRYQESYERAAAWFGRWSLTEPPLPVAAGPRRRADPAVRKVPAGLAAPHPYLALDDGLLAEFGFERLLQSELGTQVEGQEPPKTITIFRLQELFRPVLRTASIDDDLPPDATIAAILSTEESYIPVTHQGRYLRLIPRLTGIAAVVRALAASRDRAA